MQLHLRVETGSGQGKLISVNRDKFLIGRSDDCHLRPKSESISRRHCAIVRKDGRILIIDLKSRNGTEVNGKKLDPSRAKILKDGDHIKVGKLEFTAVIEAGLSNVKKAEVKDVKEAAARVAEALTDSRFEDVDVSSWLEEADQFERQDGPVTRQFQLENLPESSELSGETVMDAKAEADTKADETSHQAGKKKKPGKLPPVPKGKLAETSKDAAQETLRKFFSGR